MESKRYRFNIRERLQTLTPDKRRYIFDQIEKRTSISKSKLKRIIYLADDEPYTIDYTAILAFAVLLNVSTEELDNNLTTFKNNISA